MTRFNPYRIRLCIICTILPGQTVFARQETNFRNPVMKYLAEILLKVALNTINQIKSIKQKHITDLYFYFVTHKTGDQYNCKNISLPDF
jgi:hypothetical protein